MGVLVVFWLICVRSDTPWSATQSLAECRRWPLGAALVWTGTGHFGVQTVQFPSFSVSYLLRTAPVLCRIVSAEDATPRTTLSLRICVCFFAFVFGGGFVSKLKLMIFIILNAVNPFSS